MDSINIIDNDNNHLAPPPSIRSPFLKPAPQSQSISNQSSTIPPPPPSLVLPTPTITLIKRYSYESRVQNELDQEFQNALTLNDIKLIKRLAEKGHSSSQAWLGSSYFYGENNIRINPDKAYKWLKKAATQDHPKACFDLFRYYGSTGNDTSKIELWLEKSCNLGYEDGLAIYSNYLHDGTLNYHNYQKAFNLFKLSAALKVDNNCFTKLGICFYEGHGHTVDYNEAYRFFYTAVQQYKEEIGMFYLSLCLYYGQGVERNYQLAFEWLKKSSDLGYAEGINGLGLCYLRGHGVQKDLVKAKDLFTLLKYDYPDLDTEPYLKVTELCINHRYEPNQINNYIQETMDLPLKPKYSKSNLKPHKFKKHTFGLSSNTAEVLGIVSSTFDAGYQF